MKIRMCGITVNDPVKAFKFYTEILGFQEYMFDPAAMLAIVVSPEAPDGTALILEPNINPISKDFQTKLYAAKIPCITLSVDNLKEEYIRLVNLDVNFIKEPKKEAWGWDSMFDDGQGNYIQLMQEM